MSDWDIYRKTLEEVFGQVKIHYENEDINICDSLSQERIRWLQVLVEHIESQKSVVAVTITSLLKKIVSPAQDIRYHRDEFHGGYSGRSLDTNVVTPWLKEHFPRFAPKESGWLTRSIEQPHPFTMQFPGKVRNKDVKNAFLSILNDIQENSTNPSDYLKCLLYFLLRKHGQGTALLRRLIPVRRKRCELSVDIVVNMLKEHFSMKRSSRLPVIAIYTIYQFFVENIKRYEDKILKPLKSHTTSDRYMGFADVEICNRDYSPFELVEIKHNIRIDKTMIKDALRKTKGTTIKRFYILTTAEPNFKDSPDEIFELVRSIKLKYDIEIIPNGIYPSLKYYLRFVSDLGGFLDRYTNNLEMEFNKTVDIKEIHIREWMAIMQKYYNV